MASIYRSLQRTAHERPVIFWSLLVGFAGPTAVLIIPNIRRNYFGYKTREGVPNTYPLPHRPRRAVQGYEDP